MKSQEYDNFVRLLTAHQHRVYAYILGMVPNWADADEVLQETNVRLWQEWEKFDPGSDFGAWALKVAYYQVLTFRKSASRRREQPSQEFVAAVAQCFEQTDDLTTARAAALRSCFAKLTPDNQELIRKCYSPGAIIREVAAQLNRSVDATYRALSRAREALRKCIRRRLTEEGQS